MRPHGVILIGCLLLTGCTHLGLQRNTINQFRTISELHQQQVLDNLAMFVYDPAAVPFFSVLGNGLNEVLDVANASSESTIDRPAAGAALLFKSQKIVAGASRNAKQNWVHTPVNDPRRLELMRCAYQKVVGPHLCGPAAPTGGCPDCEARWRDFYGTTEDGRLKDKGRVTSDCLGVHGPWFGWSAHKKDVPTDCRCVRVGHYCGIYVWVLPSGRDEFAKLTLAILDYATNQPAAAPVTPLKEIEWYLTEDYEPTTRDEAALVVRGTIRADDPSKSILKGDPAVVRPAAQAEQERLRNFMGPRTPADDQQAERRLKRLERLETFSQQIQATPDPRPIFLPPTTVAPYQDTRPPDFQFLNQRLQQVR